ncbi:class I SAM-dependent methyltransferase [Mangrovivirga sp. M17]|uniref:Class I SAM-dependent methyltransferase n=1 Tax=Mangrovivirga halotolerans TaxID=2993936 RepID=A0ABT3RPJ0_9BACT|nr:class I SAM-dependent methyltransferase [Mangrovivirga halotolerans]MCX2743720.1 class I SAM-dependent methyltransferase [Mangrovivirga halotolerans]
MKQMWDERYSGEEYAYGTSPNIFFKEAIDKYNINGNILMPAEGEGRNAVYAAKKGLNVTAFDISTEGRKKALKLARKENVEIDYHVGDFMKMDISNKKYDVAALIFAHFPPELLSKYHKKIANLIKPGGFVILEGFSKNHYELRQADPKAGGPPDIDMLFSIESIKEDFSNFKILQLKESETHLSEGKYHNGLSRIIRLIGKKIV